MSDRELKLKQLNESIKYVVGILFLTFVSTLILLTILDIFGYTNIAIGKMLGFNPFYIFWGILSVVVHIYLLNTKLMENPQHKEDMWKIRSVYVGSLCSLMFISFLYAIAFVVALEILMKLIIKIDISETEYLYRLFAVTLTICFLFLYKKK